MYDQVIDGEIEPQQVTQQYRKGNEREVNEDHYPTGQDSKIANQVNPPANHFSFFLDETNFFNPNKSPPPIKTSIPVIGTGGGHGGLGQGLPPPG